MQQRLMAIDVAIVRLKICHICNEFAMCIDCHHLYLNERNVTI